MKQYICEIKDIARANNAGSFSDACDMFLANVRNADIPDAQYHYKGADTAVNYNALRNKLPKMEEKKAALVAFHQDNIKKANALYNANKRVELRKWANEALV